MAAPVGRRAAACPATRVAGRRSSRVRRSGTIAVENDRSNRRSMPDLAGKHGLIVGVANKRSISWAIAQAASAAGARLALTYPSERLEENVRELAGKLDNPVIAPCD